MQGIFGYRPIGRCFFVAWIPDLAFAIDLGSPLRLAISTFLSAFRDLVTAASGRSNHTGPGVFAPDITHKSAQELGMCSYKKQERGFFQWKEL